MSGSSSVDDSEVFRGGSRCPSNFFGARKFVADSSEELSNPDMSTFLKVDFNGDSAIDFTGLSNSVVSSLLKVLLRGVLATPSSGLSNSVGSSFLKSDFTGEFTSDSSSQDGLRAEGNLNCFAGGDP